MKSKLFVSLALVASVATASASSNAGGYGKAAVIAELTSSGPAQIAFEKAPDQGAVPLMLAIGAYLIVTTAAVSFGYHEYQTHHGCVTARVGGSDSMSDTVFDLGPRGGSR